MKGVLIENSPALDCMKTYDSDNTLFYVDPPYPHDLRYDKSMYKVEMSDDDHRELAKCVKSVKGMVVLSGYACELYDKELYPDWKRVTKKTHADGAKERTEVLWLNAAALKYQRQIPLF